MRVTLGQRIPPKIKKLKPGDVVFFIQNRLFHIREVREITTYKERPIVWLTSGVCYYPEERVFRRLTQTNILKYIIKDGRRLRVNCSPSLLWKRIEPMYRWE